MQPKATASLQLTYEYILTGPAMAYKRPRCLLLTFDAFSTLFHPRRPVPELYSSVASSFGLPQAAVAPVRLQAAFKNAFKAQSKVYPNYGRDKVLRGEYEGPRQWWAGVLRATFAEALGKHDIELPGGMIDKLLDMFASQEGYSLYDDVRTFFDKLSGFKQEHPFFDSIVTGVISNSDDRVPAVLKSLGLSVGNTRADIDRSSTQLPGFEESVGQDFEIDASNKSDLNMIITSYEAGQEKPGRLIFDVAIRQAKSLLKDINSVSNYNAENVKWTCIHVGDDLAKDHQGAIDAGWHGILLDRETTYSRNPKGVTIIHSLEALLPEIQRYTSN
jgi:FMN phosphatase YigB (HAD superfamily)